MKHWWRVIGVMAMVTLWCSAMLGPVMAEEDMARGTENTYALQPITVEAQQRRNLQLNQGNITVSSVGLPTSVIVITPDDLKRMAIFDVTDLLRKVPGLSVYNYDQGNIGFGLQLRGFRSAGAKDTAVFVDGVPMNLVQGKINGWVDLDWLIPEMIERIEIIKGPFSALYGDFALAGAINITTKKKDESSIGASAGTYGTYGGVATISNLNWKVEPFLVWEGYNRDGYRDNSDYQRGQLFNKFTLPVWDGYLSGRLHYATRDWGVSDYIKLSDVQSGRLEPTDTLDPTSKGDTDLLNFTVNYAPKNGEAGLHATAFMEEYSNNQAFYFPPTPQMRFFDDRTRLGTRLFYDFVPREDLSLVVGNETRYDKVDYSYKFARNFDQIIAVLDDYTSRQLSTGFFAQAQYKPFKFLKLMGGLRYDYFDIDVDNKIVPEKSGTANPDIFSPKIGIVLTPYKNTNLFANYGTGFRSPAVWELSSSDNSPKNLGLGVAEIESFDMGANVLLWDRLYLGIDFYHTSLEREVAVNPKTGLYENMGESTRKGVDLEAKIYLPYNFQVYGSYGYVHGRLDNPSVPGANRIRSLPEDVATAGLSWSGTYCDDHAFGFDVYYNYYGDRPLDKFGIVKEHPFDMFSAKINYAYKHWLFSLEGQYTPDELDTQWSYLSGGEVWFLPQPEFQGMLRVKYRF